MLLAVDSLCICNSEPSLSTEPAELTYILFMCVFKNSNITVTISKIF